MIHTAPTAAAFNREHFDDAKWRAVVAHAIRQGWAQRPDGKTITDKPLAPPQLPPREYGHVAPLSSRQRHSTKGTPL